MYWQQILNSWWNFCSELFQTSKTAWWISKRSRNWFYWQNDTCLDDISKPNTDADVRINSCPGKRFRYVDMFMDVILTIVFYDTRNGLSKVFRFNLLNQIWLVFWLIIWISEWTNERTNRWRKIFWKLWCKLSQMVLELPVAS